MQIWDGLISLLRIKRPHLHPPFPIPSHFQTPFNSQNNWLSYLSCTKTSLMAWLRTSEWSNRVSHFVSITLPSCQENAILWDLMSKLYQNDLNCLEWKEYFMGLIFNGVHKSQWTSCSVSLCCEDRISAPSHGDTNQSLPDNTSSVRMVKFGKKSPKKKRRGQLPRSMYPIIPEPMHRWADEHGLIHSCNNLHITLTNEHEDFLDHILRIPPKGVTEGSKYVIKWNVIML